MGELACDGGFARQTNRRGNGRTRSSHDDADQIRGQVLFSLKDQIGTAGARRSADLASPRSIQQLHWEAKHSLRAQTTPQTRPMATSNSRPFTSTTPCRHVFGATATPLLFLGPPCFSMSHPMAEATSMWWNPPPPESSPPQKRVFSLDRGLDPCQQTDPPTTYRTPPLCRVTGTGERTMPPQNEGAGFGGESVE